MKNPCLFIIAGEASGDLHGAHLVKNLSLQSSSLDIYAMGGQQLANAGAKLIVDSTKLSVVGFLEVLGKLKLIRQAFKKIKHALTLHQPDVVILIDYPGFNLRLARIVKKRSPKTKVIYYISPQIWAWRYKRIRIIKQFVDLMAVIFPFEVPLYRRAGVPVKFVGHPLTGQVNLFLSQTKGRQFFGLHEQSKVIGLMPGSRLNEIKYLLPTILKSAQILEKTFPSIEFLLPLASTITNDDIKPYLNTSLNIKIVRQKSYEAISCCDAVIVASGTATLEIAMLAKPMVIVYKGSYLSFTLAKRLVKIKYVGLCNIMAEEEIVKEFLQRDAKPEKIAQEIIKILQNQQYQDDMTAKLKTINFKLEEEQNASESLSSIVLKMTAL